MMGNPDAFSVYLDLCCLGRPFDDQSQPRVRLESESVLLVLDRFHSGEWTWIGSETLIREANQAPDPEHRLRVSTFMEVVRTIVEEGQEVKARAAELESLGFQKFDALHLASAELAPADVFLTTDDRLLRAAKRAGDKILIRVDNPLTWLKSVVDD